MVLDREFPPDIRVENEISALVAKGYEVHIACYTRKNRSSFEKMELVSVHRKPISDFIYKASIASLTLPFYFMFWKKFLRDILRSQSFDAIHIHDLPLVGVGICLKKEFHCNLIADLHENWPAFLKISKHTNTLIGKLLSPVFLWRWFEKMVLKKTDAVIVVVDEAKERLIKLGIYANKIHVVSNTIHLTGFNLKKPPLRDEIILYYAGGINYHRGLQHVIEAISQAKNPRLRFWILGEGSYKNELIRLTETLAVKEQVLFYGYKPFETVMEMLSQSDFAIIPHLKSEHTDSTIPHKIFQYMYAEKPVIASNCLPIKRILEESGAGIIYAYNNIEQLSNLFNQLETLDCNKMGESGKKAVIEKYNWNNDSKVLLNFYSKLIPS